MRANASICLVAGLWFVTHGFESLHAETVTYIYTDPQGTPLAEADSAGNITGTFDYRPYGSQVSRTPSAGPGYTGHVNDPGTGLIYMQARYFDPLSGRFLSVDPVMPKSGNPWLTNRYSYANDNPIANTDPDGRIVQIPEAADRQKVLGYINSLSSRKFTIDGRGNLQSMKGASKNSKGSEVYTKQLTSAIASKETITIRIGATAKDADGGTIQLSQFGGGTTQGGNIDDDSGHRPQLVIITGQSHGGLKDTVGAPLNDEPAHILMHELVGHAIPHIVGRNTGNAVEDENQIRRELPGGGERKAEKGHFE